MKIDKIKISWFRGSADPIELDLKLKSMVLYGENGSGKSSFVDAVEHNINEGRINHLAHEYSGKRQEKAIINTHIPGSQNGEIAITLEDNSTVETKILKNGTFTVNPQKSQITSWNYRCTILRQNEVADFIADTKGDKYSALLPLLGLGHLEVAAENLRKIEKKLAIIGDIETKKAEIKSIDAKKNLIFGNVTKEDIKKEINDLYFTYCKKTLTGEKISEIFKEILIAINFKISKIDFEQKKYISFLELSKLDIQKNLIAIEKSFAKLGESAQPLIIEKLNVLKAAISYSNKNTDEEINCPACGKMVSSASFSSHIEKEELEMKEAVVNFEVHKSNISILCENLQNIKRIISSEYIKEWKDMQKIEYISYIESINIDAIRNLCSSEIQKEIRDKIVPIVEAAKLEIVEPSPDITNLLRDKEKSETIQELIKAGSLRKKIKKIEELIDFIYTLQKIYREQIRIQSSTIIGKISSDVALMWGILHPDEKVEDIRLCLPDDVDKAIEIGLKFYGKEQDSPRLTLSEGHRNSLGLCIFLAMAKKDDSNPIILDDVVVSFDRNHRGMVGTLLEKEFSDRQIILFTHERSWYIDLRAQLNQKRWTFKTLMPWESPEVGIRFSTTQYTLDDARAYLSTSPDTAGNTARKIMDTTIATIAESLKINLPYLKGEKNDHRTSHEFLEKIAASKDSFQIKSDGINYQLFTEALEEIKEADKLIISWGNRSSHDFDIVKNEAKSLIDSCEKVLHRFTCPKCEKKLDFLLNEKSNFKQCECGYIKWKYEK